MQLTNEKDKTIRHKNYRQPFDKIKPKDFKPPTRKEIEENRKIDQAGRDSFPASDPPSWY